MVWSLNLQQIGISEISGDNTKILKQIVVFSMYTSIGK